MPARLPDEVKALLDAPNFWHLATVNPDGSPQLRDIDALATKYMGVETYPFLQPGNAG